MSAGETSPYRVWPDGTVQATDEDDANYLVNIKPFEHAARSILI